MNNTSIKTAKAKVDFSWQIFTVFAFAILATMIPLESFAANDNPFQTVLCNVVNFFTGPIGKAIATIAVIFVGIGALMGKISWGLAFIVAVGIALVFGAAALVNAVSSGVPGSTGQSCGG
jgi:type IV secretion system protein VirB2